MQFIGDYKINLKPKSLLGQGAFGYVYRGENVNTKEKVAAKCLRPEKSNEAQILQEIKIMQEVGQHPNILGILENLEEEEDIEDEDVESGATPKRQKVHWIMMSLCSLGNLAEYSLKYCLEEGNKLVIMKEVTSALAFLHERPNPIQHRDVKPENILFCLEGDRHVSKLADYGVSKIMETAFFKESSIYATFAGTKPYMAPEYFKGEHLRYDDTDAVDAFAAGVTFNQLLEGQPGRGLKVLADDELPGRTMWQKRSEHWSPVVVHDEDSPLVREVKLVLGNMVDLIPRRRRKMVQVEELLLNLITHFSVDPPVPQLSRSSADTVHVAATTSAAAPSPSIVTTKLTFTQIAKYELPFECSTMTAFSKDGVVLEDNYGSNLIKLKLEHSAAGTRYDEVWRKKRPAEMRKWSEKVLLHTGQLITRSQEVNLTLVYTPQLDSPPQATYTTHSDGDHLVAEFPPDRLLYYNHSTKRLSVHRASDHAHLRDLSQSVESDHVSAARHPQSKWFAITCRHGSTLDIYNTVSEHVRRIVLPFEPDSINAVACVKDLVVILKWGGGLHIYNWQGDKVQEVSREELGLGGDYIWGIGAGPRDTLQLYWGESLHVYKCE